jgi:potassium efflux system protein
MALNDILEFITKLMSYEVHLGSTNVSVSSILVVFLIFCGFIVLSKIVRTFFEKKFFPRLNTHKSTEFAILKLTHYVIIALGLLVSLDTLGVNVSSLAFVAGFLSVGIGFGLQNIVQNFVAGLILLFEQPIRVGDWVTVNDQEGEVKEINLRATGIETLDSIYIIVPNQDLIVSQVINGSKGEPHIRVHTQVGVSYSSDMNQVRDILLKVAAENKEVLTKPAPEAVITGFGDSSVDFKLLCFVADPRRKNSVRVKLLWEIWFALKSAGVEIPFPQRDLHLKTTDISSFPIQMLPRSGGAISSEG